MKTLRIKDICDKGSSNLKQKDVQGFDGKYPVYGASGVIGKINDYHQDKEYIAIVKDGSGIGRVSFMPAYSSVIGTLQYILPKQGYNIKYISYCLQSLDLASSKQGAAIPHIYFRDYGEFLVNVEENIDKQQQIVSFLDSEFEKIEALKANAEKQLQAAKDLFQAALKELLTPKEGWVEKKLEEVCQIKSGYAFKSGTFTKDGFYQIIRMGNVRPGLIRYDESPIFLPKECDVKILNKSYLNIGDVIITLTGTRHKRDYGYTTIIDRDNLLLNQRLASIRTSHFLNNKFLLYYTWTNAFKDQFFANEGGTVGQGNVGMDAIKKSTIRIPSVCDQECIADRLDALSANVKALQTNYTETITLCNDLKQSLLKKVFE